jgi:hypothetical protein
MNAVSGFFTVGDFEFGQIFEMSRWHGNCTLDRSGHIAMPRREDEIMSLLHNLRAVALAVMLAIPALAPFTQPAGAAVIQGQAPARTSVGLPEMAWPAAAAHAAVLPAGVAGLRVGAPQAEECTDCREAAPPSIGRRGSTLSVNLAILVLGTLWVGLMLRRIQLRSALDTLRDAGPRHAAGGH